MLPRSDAGSALDVAPDRPGPGICSAVLPGDGRCAGYVAAALFKHALCSCGRLTAIGGVQTDSFDSASGSGERVRSGAPVGINQGYILGANAGTSDFGGSLSVAAGGFSYFSTSQVVRGDLRVAGDVTGAGSLEIMRDAWVVGNLLGGVAPVGATIIRRDLHQPNGYYSLVKPGGMHYQGRSFGIASPCPCGASAPLDIGAVVAAAARENDNAAIGLARSAWSELAGSTQTRLPCGRYSVTRIGGAGPLELEIADQVILVVEGAISLSAGVRVNVAPGASLDLFVGGGLRSGLDAIKLAESSRPASFRLYLGADAPQALSSFRGFVYAPRVEVSFDSAQPAEISGAAFLGAVTATKLSVHYDREILRANEGCQARPTGGGCGAVCGAECPVFQACVDGQCAACAGDADCCPPLVCRQGKCGPLLL